MSLLADLKILYHLTLSPVRGKTHSERLESFYGKQAAGYDDFRKRLLKGREEMCGLVPEVPGGVYVDVGGGTGANLEFLGPKLQTYRQAYIVDLSTSLLKMADERIARQGWTNVQTIAADATTFVPPESADVVTFSYSLTMIPDWFAALEQAYKFLKPGGTIGIVDFYVSRKYPEAGQQKHGWFTQSFWPVWFRSDNVYPSPDHVPFLHRKFCVEKFVEARAKVPYMPFVRTPYYIFIGRKEG